MGKSEIEILDRDGFEKANECQDFIVVYNFLRPMPRYTSVPLYPFTEHPV